MPVKKRGHHSGRHGLLDSGRARCRLFLRLVRARQQAPDGHSQQQDDETGRRQDDERTSGVQDVVDDLRDPPGHPHEDIALPNLDLGPRLSVPVVATPVARIMSHARPRKLQTLTVARASPEMCQAQDDRQAIDASRSRRQAFGNTADKAASSSASWPDTTASHRQASLARNKSRATAIRPVAGSRRHFSRTPSSTPPKMAAPNQLLWLKARKQPSRVRLRIRRQ